MSYAVLSELWPDWASSSNKFKKYFNTLPENIVNNLIDSSDNRGGNKYNKDVKTNVQPVAYEKSRDHPLDYKQPDIKKLPNIYLGKYYSECSTLLKHLSKCEKCRTFVQNKFAPTPDDKEKKENDEYLDLAIYIVTGIFP